MKCPWVYMSSPSRSPLPPPSPPAPSRSSQSTTSERLSHASDFLDFGPDFGPKKLLYGCLTHYLRNIISERKISFVISILLKCYKIKIITLSHLKVSFIKYQYFCWWSEKTPDYLILIYQRRIYQYLFSFNNYIICPTVLSILSYPRE